MLTENDAFLTELGKLFAKSRSAGSLRIVFKRHDGRTKPLPSMKHKKKPWTFKPKKGKAADGAGSSSPIHPSTSSTSEPRCLVRAALGSKKISTNVVPKDMNKFQVAFTTSLKTNVDGLKKKDKKAEKKSKAAAAAGGQQQTAASSAPPANK